MSGSLSTTAVAAFGAATVLFVATNAGGITLKADGTAGNAGATAEVVVRLGGTADAPVAAVQADVYFDAAHTPIAMAADGRPDCAVNPSIRKSATRFAFHPSGCAPGRGECSSVRAVVIATDNVDVIPPGAELYRCRVALAPQARPGGYPLTISNALYAPPTGGDRIPDVAAGVVTVMGASPVAATPAAAASGSGGGCGIDAHAGAMPLWVLIGPLVWRRRRRARRHA
jgi:hypothetical protein